jgi:hypothetical protein
VVALCVATFSKTHTANYRYTVEFSLKSGFFEMTLLAAVSIFRLFVNMKTAASKVRLGINKFIFVIYNQKQIFLAF